MVMKTAVAVYFYFVRSASPWTAVAKGLNYTLRMSLGKENDVEKKQNAIYILETCN